MPIIVIWKNGIEEKIDGEDFTQDGSFLRIFATRLERENKTQTIRMIPLDRFIVARQENRIVSGYAKRKI